MIENRIRSALFGVVCLAAQGASANDKAWQPTTYSMEHCLSAALRQMPGTVLSLEREEKNGVSFYEFEIRGKADRLVWEVECNADTGEITQIERDVKADDSLFALNARVSLDEAVRIAKRRIAGRLTEVEYEVSPDGRTWYELTLVTAAGRDHEVMVDAFTGEILGVDDDEGSRTLYRIGLEQE